MNRETRRFVVAGERYPRRPINENCPTINIRYSAGRTAICVGQCVRIGARLPIITSSEASRAPKCPIGAREAGHSNILRMGLLMVWYCSTSVNQHQCARLRTTHRRNGSAMSKSGHVTGPVKVPLTWRACSIFRNSGSVRLFRGGGIKANPAGLPQRERPKSLVF
jgi:hypothetical protein